jgi:hypothetical protein
MRGSGLGDVDTSVYGPAANYGSDAVEAWRPAITKAAGTLPVEFLLAWIGVESGGNPCDWETATGSIEAGIFQLMSPDNINAGSTTLAAQQPSPPCPASSFAHGSFSALSDDQVQAMIDGGITYVNYCVGYAEAMMLQYGYSFDSSSADYWSLVKMVHVAPGTISQMMQSATNANSSASTWADLIASPYGSSLPANWTTNASVVGQYGAGSNAALNILGNTISSLQYLTLAEMLLIGVAAAGGVAGAYFLNRWLQPGHMV